MILYEVRLIVEPTTFKYLLQHSVFKTATNR